MAVITQRPMEMGKETVQVSPNEQMMEGVPKTMIDSPMGNCRSGGAVRGECKSSRRWVVVRDESGVEGEEEAAADLIADAVETRRP